MAKHYKETPWWWYISILVGSFILGLVVVIKENITLPAWAYVVSLIMGIIIAPVVSLPIRLSFVWAYVDCFFPEHSALLSLWKWNCHKQSLQNASWSYAARKTCWQHVLRCLVPQRYFQRCEPVR